MMLQSWQIRHEPRCGQCRKCVGPPLESQREVEVQIEGEGYGKLCRYCDTYLDNITIQPVARLCPDPIATVRCGHPYAYCRPPVGPGFVWAAMEHAAAPWGPAIAEGATEAAAWSAAAAVVTR